MLSLYFYFFQTFSQLMSLYTIPISTNVFEYAFGVVWNAKPCCDDYWYFRLSFQFLTSNLRGSNLGIYKHV